MKAKTDAGKPVKAPKSAPLPTQCEILTISIRHVGRPTAEYPSKCAELLRKWGFTIGLADERTGYLEVTSPATVEARFFLEIAPGVNQSRSFQIVKGTNGTRCDLGSGNTMFIMGDPATDQRSEVTATTNERGDAFEWVITCQPLLNGTVMPQKHSRIPMGTEGFPPRAELVPTDQRLIKAVVELVSDECIDVTPERLYVGKWRGSDFPKARRAIVFICHHLFGQAFQDIAPFLGVATNSPHGFYMAARQDYLNTEGFKEFTEKILSQLPKEFTKDLL